jgi:hypothetical protein
MNGAIRKDRIMYYGRKPEEKYLNVFCQPVIKGADISNLDVN